MDPEPPPHELRTARLLLRRWRPEDAAPFAALNDDPRVMEHFPSLLTRAESDALIVRIERSFADDALGLWVVEAGGRFAGFAGMLWQLPPLPFAPAVEVGWRFAAHAWGHGYATEAAAAALDDGFSRLKLPEVVSMTAKVNHRSIAVMQRLGMTRDRADDFRHHKIDERSHLAPHVLYRLRRADWPGARVAVARASAQAEAAFRAAAT
ncbi:MAG: GNAT family N-acetyltransferase [Patulibacter minatonensis]